MFVPFSLDDVEILCGTIVFLILFDEHGSNFAPYAVLKRIIRVKELVAKRRVMETSKEMIRIFRCDINLLNNKDLK